MSGVLRMPAPVSSQLVKSEDLARLNVVTCVVNPVRYRNRWRLYEAFAKHVEDAGADLWTVEAAFGDRPFEVTEAGHPRHIQLRTNTEFWLKENLLNIGFSRLPHDWKYAAWMDADVQLVRPDWVHETIHQLQHYAVVQMFSHAVDLNARHEMVSWNRGFVQSHLEGRKYGYGKYYGQYWHPGFAWAIRREAFDALGGLLDFCLGSADMHMACAMLGMVERSIIVKGLTKSYLNKVYEWQERAEKYVRRNIGVMEGMLCHGWHGCKRNRKYVERWDILVDNKYDPDLDLKRDWQGVWQLTDRNHVLRDQIREYFRSRDEDSTESPFVDNVRVDLVNQI